MQPTGRSLTHRAAWTGTDRWMDFVLVFALWGVSAIGNIAGFNGGFQATFRGSWNPFQWRISAAAFVLGVLCQLFLQWRQFANCHAKQGWRYRSALLLSVLFAVIGFVDLVPWLADPVATALFAESWPLFYALAFVLLVLVFGAVDVLQEYLLFRE